VPFRPRSLSPGCPCHTELDFSKCDPRARCCALICSRLFPRASEPVPALASFPSREIDIRRHGVSRRDLACPSAPRPQPKQDTVTPRRIHSALCVMNSPVITVPPEYGLVRVRSFIFEVRRPPTSRDHRCGSPVGIRAALGPRAPQLTNKSSSET